MGGRLLLVAATAGYQARAFARAAQELGHSVTLATDRCHVLEDPWQDQAIAVRFHDTEPSVDRIATLGSFDAVLAVGDRPALLAAMLAERLRLPFHSVAAVETCCNKFLFRQKLQSAGLRIPGFFRMPLGSQPDVHASLATYPCVLKPLTMSASRGVIRANNPAEFLLAFQRIERLLNKPEVRALRDSALEYIQVEDYIPGTEFAVEGVVRDGRARILAVFDKPDPLTGPFFEEAIYVTPSRSPDQQIVREAVEAAVAAAGLANGPIHGEVRVNEAGAWVLEIAPRPIGGLCARTMRFQDGSGLESFLIRYAFGDPAALQMELAPGASGVMMIPVPEEGIYHGVDGLERAAAVDFIDHIQITAKPGQRLLPWPEGSSYAGFIFARAPEPAQVEEALRRSHSLMRFRLTRVLPVSNPGTSGQRTA